MRYGYARVSTEDQSLQIQIDELTNAGCGDIRSEKVSGKSLDKREEFVKLLRELKRGDELWVVRIDRFARSLVDLATLVRDLRKRGVAIKATQQPIDTTSASGNAFLGMLGVFAEFERSITAERQAAGIAAAKLLGKYEKCGRPRVTDHIDRKEVKEMLERDGRVKTAKHYRLSESAIYRMAREAA